MPARPRSLASRTDARVAQSLESWFVARDADGEAQGLAIDVVEEATLPLHELVGKVKFKAGK